MIRSGSLPDPVGEISTFQAEDGPCMTTRLDALGVLPVGFVKRPGPLGELLQPIAAIGFMAA